jgi:hypothetical protein
MSTLKKESLLPVIIPIQMDRARAATFPKIFIPIIYLLYSIFK